jgi:hypothetical protein
MATTSSFEIRYHDQDGPFTTLSLAITSPEVGNTIPEIVFIKVDFPQPE